MTTIDDGDDLNALYRMVGGIVVVWGGAEQMLTAVVTLLYGEYGGRRLTMAKRHPVHLKPKLEFIERCI